MMDKMRIIRMKKGISWLTLLALIFGAGGSAVAGSTSNEAMMVTARVIDSLSVRGSQEMTGISTFAQNQVSKETMDSSVPYSITVGKTSNVMITGKIDSPIPTGTTLYMSSATPAEETGRNNVKLSTNEQNLIPEMERRIGDCTSITYTFSPLLTEDTNTLNEIKQTKPIIVTLTVTF